MTQENEPYLTRPTTQTDLEARREADYRAAEVKTDPNATVAPYAVEDNDTSAYVGVDADKMTYAEDTHKPLRGDGVEDKVASEQLKGYAVAKKQEGPEREQTLGGGSEQPLAQVVTSGSSVTHKLVGEIKAEEDGSKTVKAAKAALEDGKPSEPTPAQTPAPNTGQKPAPKQAKAEDNK